MKAFPEYKYETGSTFQPEWEQYLMLYPSETNLERMQNRRAARGAGEAGRRARSSAQGRSLAALRRRSLARGLPRDAAWPSISPSKTKAWRRRTASDMPFALVVSRVDSVDTHTINGITLELARLAGEYCARYDGWECPVTRGEAAQQ